MSEKKDRWTILEVLDWTRKHFEQRGLESPRLEAELILAHVLGIQRVMLYARFDQPLGTPELDRIRPLVARRAKREPMAYLMGTREFYSLDFEVTPAVLIPRPDTETLIEVALERLRGREAPRIADVGTGSGCIAVTLAHELPGAEVWALDVSREALEVARRNIARHQLEARVTAIESDLLEALPAAACPLDLVAANLPYIPTRQLAGLMADVRDFEPHLALDGGPDGLILVARLAEAARRVLAPGGALVLETGPDEVPKTAAMLGELGYHDVKTHLDPGGLLRIIEGRLPG